MQMIAFLPMRLRPSPRPTVVVVLPSPAGVGLMAVTRISLPSLLPCTDCDELGRDLGLVVAVGQQMLRRDADLGADLLDRLLLGRARDFDVGLEFGHRQKIPSVAVPVLATASIRRLSPGIECPMGLVFAVSKQPRNTRIATANRANDECDRDGNGDRRDTRCGSWSSLRPLQRDSTLLISTRLERTRRM